MGPTTNFRNWKTVCVAGGGDERETMRRERTKKQQHCKRETSLRERDRDTRNPEREEFGKALLLKMVRELFL